MTTTSVISKNLMKNLFIISSNAKKLNKTQKTKCKKIRYRTT